MAEFSSSEAIFSFDQPGGSLTEYHDGITSVSWDGARDNSQSGSLGTNNIKKTYVGKDALTGEIVVKKDTTANSAYRDLYDWMYNATYRGQAFTLRIEEPDGEVGSFQHDLEVKLTNMSNSKDANSGEPAEVTFQWGCDGSYTQTVIT
jgi:hypothetical protein